MSPLLQTSSQPQLSGHAVAFSAAQSTLKHTSVPNETQPDETRPNEARHSSRFPAFRSLPGRVRRLWKKTRRGLLVLLVVAALVHASVNIYASVMLNRELAQIRQKSEPLTIVALAPPDVPAAQNAAPLYKQAVAALRLSRSEEAAIENAGRPGAVFSRAAVDALQKNRPALELVRRAASQPQCRFPVDWNGAPHQILLPHYAEVRRLARLLAAQSLQCAHSRDRDTALRDVRALFRMSDHLAREPVLIGFLVARATHSLATVTLSRVLEASPVPAAQARSFLASLPATDWSASYRRTLLAERAFTIWGFNAAREDWLQAREDFGIGRPDTPGVVKCLGKPLTLFWSPLLKLDELYALRLWERALASVTPMQVPAPRGESALLRESLDDAPRYATITRFLFPELHRAREVRDSIEAAQRQVEVALALSHFRSRHGRYPARLQQAAALWGKAVPVDPYHNQPFQYRSDGRNFTLYSIGPNRIDDGGHSAFTRKRPNSGTRGDDIVWGPQS
ncbi:MAG: hypothetical protein JWN98_2436 [Abditibacteriota bacterium]|nr:hypothetical protein [Abditibacteriota bacterium]